MSDPNAPLTHGIYSRVELAWMMNKVYITEKITFLSFIQQKHSKNILRDERTQRNSLIIRNLQSSPKGFQIMEK